MQQLILVVHIIVAICLIVLVLIQHGKGADVGAAFGSGASNTMFGSIGATPFLIKLTAGLAGIFFATSLLLGYVTISHTKKAENILGAPVSTETKQTQTIPMGTPAPYPSSSIPNK